MFGNIMRGIRAWQRHGARLKGAYWTNARMVFADLPVDPAVVKPWLPFPLRLSDPARVTFFIAHYPECVWGEPYHEVGLLVNVKLFGIFPMVHCAWMLVDDDTHLINGREMLGYPKKMAAIRFEEKDGKIFGTATRRGKEICRVEGVIGRPLDAPPPGIGRWSINARHLLTFTPGHLVMFLPKELKTHAANAIDLKVTLTPTESDPICRVIGPAENATIRTCDIGSAPVPPIRIWPVGPFFQATLMQLRIR